VVALLDKAATGRLASVQRPCCWNTPVARRPSPSSVMRLLEVAQNTAQRAADELSGLLQQGDSVHSQVPVAVMDQVAELMQLTFQMQESIGTARRASIAAALRGDTSTSAAAAVTSSSSSSSSSKGLPFQVMQVVSSLQLVAHAFANPSSACRMTVSH